MALGASREDVLRLAVKQGMRLTVYGLAAGLVLSLLLTRSFERLLYGVSAIDPLTMIGVTVLLLVVGVAACYLPAMKAMRINPVSAMREN
jgi:ABC-type lipoprotein release transport system permease subunit